MSRHTAKVKGTKYSTKRSRNQFDAEESPFIGTKAAKAMQAGPMTALGSSGEGPRGLGNSKSMVHLGRQLSNSTAPGQPYQPLQQQAVVYSCLDDLTSRVEIYKGRHSLVWNAVCKRTRRPLILKGYVKEKMTERNFHQVRREIRLMQIINYDGAVKLLGHFEDETTIYLVQEQCAKGDLFKRLLRHGGMLEEKFVAGEVILPMLLTLEYLHGRLIYHRDIKPENIFFTRDGKFKLGDFGLAIDASLERSKSRVGTLDYMSPEVVSLPTADERKKMEAAGRPPIEQPYGEKCDIWACGVLAYELMVGKPPFEVKDEAETRKRIMYETTLKIPPHVSPDAVNFIKTALAKNAGMRPSASDLIHHPWLRPYLLAMAQQATGHLDSSSLSVYKSVPSLGASCSTAAATAADNNIPTLLSNGSSQSTLAGVGFVGRSASFTSTSRAGINPPGRLQAPADAQGALPAGQVQQQQHLREAGAQHSFGSPLAGQLHINTGHGNARPCSPTMPNTPGPYGPPGMSRKPIWEVENSANSFTAVRTVGLSGDVTSSPTSPRVSKGPTSMFSSGGGNPLLKAALNANLNRIHTTLTSSSGAAPSPAAQQHSSTGSTNSSCFGSSVSSNVKMRLRDYFVARNPEVAVGGQQQRAESSMLPSKSRQLQDELGRGEEQQ